MRCPSLHKTFTHKELLSLIVEEMAKKARVGVHIQLLKVKSHIGIEGNEKADALAHEPCMPECCNDIASEGDEIREDIFWPHFNGKNIHNASAGAAAIVMDVPGESNQARRTVTEKTLPVHFRQMISRTGSRRSSRQGAQEASQTRRSM